MTQRSNRNTPANMTEAVTSGVADAGRELSSGLYHTAKLLAFASVCGALGAGLVYFGWQNSTPAMSGLGVGFASITAAVVAFMVVQIDDTLPGLPATTGFGESLEENATPLWRRILRAIIAALALVIAVAVAGFFFKSITPVAAAALPPGALIAYTAYRLFNR